MSPRRRILRRTPVAIAATALIALVLSACTPGDDTGTDTEGQGFPSDGCTHVTIATSSEKVNMLDELAEAFKDSPEHEGLKTCATVRPINVSSGNAARYLTAGDDWPSDDRDLWPTLWSPASTVWTDRVAAA
ncbi:MAG TPA: hypothetical protein VFF85_00205, partial [Microbacterium sp.]|nr:hypothetical protein [Microbacterium sp.]